MINLENIFNAKIINDPWPHQIIDNFLDETVFEKIKQLSEKISEIDDYDTSEIIWLNELEELDDTKSVSNDIVECADILVKNFEGISKPYNSIRQKSNLGYFNVPRFGISPANIINEIHDEGTNKIMALIVYISPEESIGTLLYSKNDENYFSKEIQWKPNRAFLMYSIPGITWHKFNSSDKKRITLNFYYEKLEALEHLNKNVSADKVNWIREKFGEGKLTTDKL
jgi:hypothetical protein